MSSYIQWQKPMIAESWTHTQVWRSATIDGVYTQIGSNVAIATSYYFDIDGTSTHYYKIRFFDSSASVYSSYSDPIVGTADNINNDLFTRTVNAITLLGTLGAVGPDSSANYTLYGMTINQNVAEELISQAYDYCAELVGDDRMASVATADTRPINGFLKTYSALLILNVLNGQAINMAFNYNVNGYSIQKPVVAQLKETIATTKLNLRKWQKILLTRYAVGENPGMDMTIINETEEDSGIEYVTVDAPSL